MHDNESLALTTYRLTCYHQGRPVVSVGFTEEAMPWFVIEFSRGCMTKGRFSKFTEQNILDLADQLLQGLQSSSERFAMHRPLHALHILVEWRKPLCFAVRSVETSIYTSMLKAFCEVARRFVPSAYSYALSHPFVKDVNMTIEKLTSVTLPEFQREYGCRYRETWRNKLDKKIAEWDLEDGVAILKCREVASESRGRVPVAHGHPFISRVKATEGDSMNPYRTGIITDSNFKVVFANEAALWHSRKIQIANPKQSKIQKAKRKQSLKCDQKTSRTSGKIETQKVLAVRKKPLTTHDQRLNTLETPLDFPAEHFGSPKPDGRRPKQHQQQKEEPNTPFSPRRSLRLMRPRELLTSPPSADRRRRPKAKERSSAMRKRAQASPRPLSSMGRVETVPPLEVRLEPGAPIYSHPSPFERRWKLEHNGRPNMMVPTSTAISPPQRFDPEPTYPTPLENLNRSPFEPTPESEAMIPPLNVFRGGHTSFSAAPGYMEEGHKSLSSAPTYMDEGHASILAAAGHIDEGYASFLAAPGYMDEDVSGLDSTTAHIAQSSDLSQFCPDEFGYLADVHGPAVGPQPSHYTTDTLGSLEYFQHPLVYTQDFFGQFSMVPDINRPRGYNSIEPTTFSVPPWQGDFSSFGMLPVAENTDQSLAIAAENITEPIPPSQRYHHHRQPGSAGPLDPATSDSEIPTQVSDAVLNATSILSG